MTGTELDVAPIEHVDLSGYRMAYRQWGDRTASAATVLVHGITSSSLSWIRVAPRLARHGRVIAVDLKGHGDSDRPEQGYRLEDQATEVAGLIHGLGLRDINLIGHSWGGAISLLLAVRYGLPLARLVLEDPAIGMNRAEPTTRQQVVESYVASVGLSREEAEARFRPNTAVGWTADDVNGKIDAAIKGSRASVRAVFDENGPWNVSDVMRELQVPTLLIRAEVANGGIVGESVLAIARQNPLVQIVTVPGADHSIHRGRFDDFMPSVERFLRVEAI